MSIKGPGIYFNEIDDTGYDTMVSTTGTTVAIVGFAKKGPINEPTEITSYNGFVNTFGTPITDQFSGLAAKYVLSAGGKVLFTRAADESKAEAASVIVKNGVDGTNGKTTVSISEKFTSSDTNYHMGAVYYGTIKHGDISNTFFVRTPKNDSMTLTRFKDAIEMAADGANTSPFVEYAIKDTPTAGKYVFTLKDDNGNENNLFAIDITASSTAAEIEKSIETAAAGTYTYEITYSNETSVIEAGTYAYKFGDEEKNRYVKVADSKGEDNIVEAVEAFNESLKDAGAFAIVDTDNKKIVVMSTSKSNVEIGVVENASSFIGNTGSFAFELKEKEGKNYTVDIEDFLSSEDETNSILFSDEYDFGNIPTTYNINAITAEVATKIAEFSGDDGDEIGIDSISGIQLKTTIVSDDINPITINAPEVGGKVTVYSEGKYYPILATEDSTGLLDDAEIEAEEGTSPIDDNAKDMVYFASKEKGTGTSNVSITVETYEGDLEGTLKHNIEIAVGGVIKETYSDVSYNPSSDDFFANLINDEVENGGSKYILTKYRKNEETTEVNLKDGIFYLGKSPKDEGGIAKTKDMKEKDYSSYDYCTGDDGIVDDIASDELFEEILGTENSLANQDLYSFHVLITPDNIDTDVQDAAIALCEKLGDSIYIADPPSCYDRDNVIKWANGKDTIRAGSSLDSNFSCCYWPWLKVYDGSKYTWVMPSVLMAAQFVSVDKKYGSWYAPAGQTNGQISAIDLECYPNKTDRDALYTGYNRINPFVKYGDGTIIAYGEKTTQRKDSTLTKIHTRRMLIDMKKQVKAALKGFIFMPSLATNISTMSAYVTTIMESFKVGGGISYYKVSTSRNTTETLQQDVVYIDVTCVPVGCIEEINVSFTLDKDEETVTAE